MPFTTAGAASAFGMSTVTATPSAQKVAEPSTTISTRGPREWPGKMRP